MIAGMILGEAEGAIPNGTTIIKVNSEKGDSHPDGTRGTVLSSMATEEADCPYFYFVEWEGRHAGVPVGVMGYKIKTFDGEVEN